MNNYEVLIYDIETRVFGMPNADRDELRIFGCYSFKTGKYYFLTNVEDIQKVIDSHKFLVGFNTENYDEPILKRAGVNFQYKIRIDLFDLFKKRAGGMKIEKGMLKDILMSYSLDYICRTLDLVDDSNAKIKIDYNLFKKDSWNADELKLIKEYTLRDLELTRKLYEWVEDYFAGFTDFINDDDVKKKRYLTVSLAKIAYKAICKAMAWTEEYTALDTIEESDEHISGGYVAYPAGDEYHKDKDGDVYVLDFQSLYPHIMMQCNLYGRKKDMSTDNKTTWYGNGKWKVEGVYYSNEMSGIGKLLRQWYFNRMYFKRTFMCYEDKKVYKMKDIEKFKGKQIYGMLSGSTEVIPVTVDDYWIEKFKKNVQEGVDKREYTIKIILNTIYGILNTAHYKKVYDMVAGGDCTRIGRQWIRYARKVFRDTGYKVVYTDTDSIYLVDPFRDKAKMLETKAKIISDIKQTVPFPQDTFDMALENEIKHIFFFRGTNISEKEEELDEDDFINKHKQLMKKNYIYVTLDNTVEIKNLGIRKKSNSELSRKIFWEHLVPQIVDGKIKFSKTYLRNLIMELLGKDINLAALRKDVGDIKDYNKSPTGLQAQISQKYGPGIHFLIPNTKGIGVGKGKSYCTIEEFNQHNLKLENIDLSNVYSELDYFMKQPLAVNIFQFDTSQH